MVEKIRFKVEQFVCKMAIVRILLRRRCTIGPRPVVGKYVCSGTHGYTDQDHTFPGSKIQD